MSKYSELVRKILDDPESYSTLSEEEATQVRKELNPYLDLGSGQSKVVNLTITNWRERYIRKFLTTALVSAVFRFADDWDPREDIDNGDRMTDEDVNAARFIVSRFLGKFFEFNPNLHLRGAWSGDKKIDLEAIRNKECKNVDEVTVTSDDRLLIKQMTNELTRIGGDLYKRIEDVDEKGIVSKKMMQLYELKSRLDKLEDKAMSEVVPKAEPPIDVFHVFNRYVDAHYDQLRKLTDDLFAERSDIEFAVKIHGVYDNEEEAKKWRQKHADSVGDYVSSVTTDGIFLLGPFKENREKMEFYNKNTEILKRMMDQQEADLKLGADLMEKKVKRGKAKNLRETGADAQGLGAYMKTIGVEGKRIVDNEQQKNLDLDEKDVIEVDYHYMDKDGKMQKGTFLSQAEEPLHMTKEGAEFATKYQPKKIVGKNGKTMTVLKPNYDGK